MSFQYVQRTGQIFEDFKLLGTGHAGKYTGLNNPDMQNVPFVGPLPCNRYKIGEAYLHPHLGPITMDLTPQRPAEMFGRDKFRIHSVNADHPLTSSDGCPCLGRPVRMHISDQQKLGNDILDVVAEVADLDKLRTGTP